LFFKKIDSGKLADPGDQLKAVLAFKKKIEEEKRYLFKQYVTLDEFADTLDGHLARWLREHDKVKAGLSLEDQMTTSPVTVDATITAPSFDYWIVEATKNTNEGDADYTAALFCASKAINAAKSDIEWAKANNIMGIAKFYLGDVDEPPAFGTPGVVSHLPCARVRIHAPSLRPGTLNGPFAQCRTAAA